MNRNSTLLFLSVLAGGAILGGQRARAQDAIVPDNFATISAALTGASDADADGVLEIFVRPGTYAEDVRIARSDVLLEGDVSAPPTIQGTGAANVVWVEDLLNATLTNVSVKNFVVTGGLTRDGVEFRRVNAGLVENVEAFGNSDGLRLNSGTGVTLRNCNAHDNLQAGIRLSGLVSSTITGNASHHNGHDGIDLSSGSLVTISNNDCHHNGDRGVRARRAFDTTIQGNQLHQNVSDAARFESVTRVSFVSNVCDANSDNGLRTRRTIDCLVSLNQFTNNGSFGIRIRDDANLDFDASSAGAQGPVGDNTFSGNSNGDVRSD